MLFFFYGVERTWRKKKAMALQRNVVYTVTRWMSVWVNAWMDVTKNTEAHMSGAGAGAGRLSDHCLILFFYGINVLVLFLSSCTGEKKGLLRNPADMKTVRYCFVTFFLESPPCPLCSLWSHFKAVGTTPSFVPCFLFSVFCMTERGREKIKMSEWKLALRLCFTPPPSQSFYKQLPAHPQTCRRILWAGTEVETATAKKRKMDCEERHAHMCRSHIKRHSKVTQSQ